MLTLNCKILLIANQQVPCTMCTSNRKYPSQIMYRALSVTSSLASRYFLAQCARDACFGIIMY